MPPKKKCRKKEQPPLSVQGLLHLEASFVAPSHGGVTLATVAPGSCYGYGDGAGHIPSEVEQTKTEMQVAPPPGPHGDFSVPPPNFSVPPPVQPPASGQNIVRISTWPPGPPPDRNSPVAYKPPEFAREVAVKDYHMREAPPTAAGGSVTPAVNGIGAIPNGSFSVPMDGVSGGVTPRPTPQFALGGHTAATLAATSTAGQGPAANQGTIRAAPALRPLPPPPIPVTTGAPVANSGAGGGHGAPDLGGAATSGAPVGWDAVGAVAAGRVDTKVLVAAAAAAADPAGHWSSGSQHPQAAAAAAQHPQSAAAATQHPQAAASQHPQTTAAAAAQHPHSAASAKYLQTAAVAVYPSADPVSEAAAVGDDLLQHYWQFVRENQYDFNGWTYLLQHVEKQTNLDAIRAVYNAFLPLYPYCYAYWKKYADLEQRSGYAERSRQILERAVRAIPLSVELWMALLNLFRDIVTGQTVAQSQTRELCERAVRSAGSQFRSDALWECFIHWETTHGTLSAVTAIYRRLLKIPTRLYNRHWDNFLQHVRDYHPRDILEREEYLALRRQCCLELDMPYREEPAFELPDPSKTQKPEVKLVSAIKEKLVGDMTAVHEETERKVEKRWKLEEKIKRPYFHVVPLDRRQLRTWREYLELEAADGDHQSLVLLYERCLIACAQYEEFWMQYARYLERQLPKTQSTASSAGAGASSGATAASAAPDATAPGAAPACSPDTAPGAAHDPAVQGPLTAPQAGGPDGASYETASQRLPEARPGVAAGYTRLEDPAAAVREVYKRACLVHCPTKPNVRLQWAVFEETSGHPETAVQLLGQVLASFPSAVRPWLQLIGLERRRQNLDECSRLYGAAAAAAPDTLRTWWAMKHARFCFKVLNKPDKALGILRTAVKKDRSNGRLYLHILDVCYQRNPVDVRGVSAALTLALSSKDLSDREKLDFRRKKVEFFEEFGTLSQLRAAEEELESAEQALTAAERKQARQQEKEQAREQQEQQEQQEEQEQQEQDEQGKAKAGAKRRSKVKMDPTPPPPLPPPDLQAANTVAEEPPMMTACPKCGWDGSSGEPAATSAAAPAPAPAVPDEPPSAYDRVPPTWDLTVSTTPCGYGKDPQYKWFLEQGYREYTAREAGGYPASLLDPVSSDDEPSEPQPPPAKRPALLPDPAPAASHIVTRDGRRVPKYVIRPQAPGLRKIGVSAPQQQQQQQQQQQLVQQPTDAPGQQEPQRRIPQLARLPAPPPQNSDSSRTNVPEWLVREGGELLLSETENGMSRIRYWPHFMPNKGVQRLFQTLRRYVKWHQTRQVAPDGRFVALKRLVAWFGPCGLEESGLMMPSNDSWSPELLDLLQRLCQFVGQEFNSCHLSLFRSGCDVHEWHGHDQPALGRNPTIALVSLGATRCFEMRQAAADTSRFLRFPLLPGSLLVMEGAMQQDWQHQVPREAQVKEERIGLQFRVMYDLKDVPGGGKPRLREPLV